MKINTFNLYEFQAVAADFVSKLRPFSDRATVVGLYGDLGAGKTTFTQSAARSLGVSERVASPTFLIMKRFKIKDLRLKFKNLIHVDAYRLKSGEELRKLGFEELLQGRGNLIFIEWADLVEDILPSNHLGIHFEFIDENTRKITMLS